MKKTVKLWNDLINRLEIANSMTSYTNYYMTIVSWLEENKQYIGEDVIREYNLPTLMKLDCKLYVNEEEPDLPYLDSEINRLKDLVPNKVDILVMIISQLLWDMVTIRSKKECSNCQNGSVRIILARYKDTQKEQLVISCEQCGWAELPNGELLSAGVDLELIPANRLDLARYGYIEE